MKDISPDQVLEYLKGLQHSLCSTFASMDGKSFGSDSWQRAEGGGGTTRILEGGELFERAGVGVSHVSGLQLPPSALSLIHI